MQIQPLFNVSFLAFQWETEYHGFRSSEKEGKLLEQLRNWNSRSQLSEVETEAAFIRLFFCDTWAG